MLSASLVSGLFLALTASAQIAFDKVNNYPLQGYATYTASGGGHTGQAGDSAMDLTTGGGSSLYITDPGFLAGVNAAAAKDTLSVSVWVNLYEIANSSVTWFYARSQDRDFQAHTPWSDDTVYFDTGGCCDGSAQRISSSIKNFSGYTGDDTWWNSWHHFVFTRNGPDKKIWIDGILFLEGSSTTPMSSDVYWVDVGSDIHEGGNSLHGKIDDYAVFGGVLSSNDVHSLFTGTPPTGLTGAPNLIGYWDFNVGKTLLVPIQAGPAATGVSPDIAAYYIIANGTSAVQQNSIKLSVNGTDVTGSATMIPVANPPLVSGTNAGATLYYAATQPFPPGSVQQVTLVYSDNGTPATVHSNTWPVTIEPYNGYVTDSKSSHLAFLEGASYFTADGAGHTGKPGDRAIDLEIVPGTGDVHVGAGNFLNQASSNNILSVSLWLKLHNVANGAAVFAESITSNGGQRGFAGFPWGDDNIYFDTAGCCDASAQRISAAISTFPAYKDDSFWTNWHHFVFLYNATDKQIWIDGVMFLDGSSSDPLPTDFRDVFFGFDPPDNAYQQGVIDDVSVFATALSAANIGQLATNNASPSSLPGETLLAYWDFNTPSAGPPFISSPSPAPNSMNNLPDVSANIQIVNTSTQVQTNTIKLALNGVDVTSAASISATPVGAAVTYASSNLLASLSSNTLTVTFSDNAATPNHVSNTWSFVVLPYSRYSRDTQHGYLAVFTGTSSFTADAGGRTSVLGDRALDVKGGSGGSGAIVKDPPFISAVNAAAAKDKFSVSYWLKQSAITASASFQLHSPSVFQGEGFQTHVPWNDDVVYFDNSGCCDASNQRIDANISTFPGWTSDVFWNSWHNFIFVRDGTNKTIYIDGQVFLAGTSAYVMKTDMDQLTIGGAPGFASPLAQMDDVALFGEALSSSQIASIAGGTPPPSLNDPNLLAFWNFSDVGPAWLGSFSPASGATGVAASGPLSHVTASLVNGSTTVKTNTIVVHFNGADQTSSSSIATSTNGVTTVTYIPPLLPSQSVNTVTVVASDSGTPANVLSNTWSYTTEAYTGVTKDILHSYPGLLQPAAVFTATGGGHTGNPGDYAIDLTKSGGAIHIDDATFLYPAETNNIMSFSFWVKKYDIANGSAFWVNSPSSSGGGRGFQAHLPWSDDTIYFDTSGCCDTTLERISAAISSFSGYTDDSFWTNHWHHFVFLYNAGDKQIWIDGTMFTDGNSSNPLALDFTDMFLGRDVGDSVNMHGLIDDFAAFASALTPTNITLLANGTLPTALTGEKLLAYWPFDDASAGGTKPVISIGITGGQIKITYTGTLQSSATVDTGYQDVTGATSPYTVNTSQGAHVFYRARQ